MKKISMLLLCVLALACAKTAPQGEKTVVFTLSGVQSGSLTKVSLDGVSAALSASAPTAYPELTIQSKTKPSRVYHATVGEPVSVAYDSYTVSGTYAPDSQGRIFYSNVFSTPSFELSGDITVTEADETYPLSVSYTCFALVCDFESTASIEISSTKTVLSDCTDKFVRYGNIGLIYLDASNTYTSASPLKVRVTPIDDANYEVSEYSMTASGTGASSRCETGKWYCFSPSAVETVSGGFDIDLPEFTQGN